MKKILFITLLSSVLFSQTSKSYLDKPIYDESAIENSSLQELRILRNMIFARNGYTFKDSYLNEYFSGKKWYKSLGVKAQDLKLTDDEIQKLNYIKYFEKNFKEMLIINFTETLYDKPSLNKNDILDTFSVDDFGVSNLNYGNDISHYISEFGEPSFIHETKSIYETEDFKYVDLIYYVFNDIVVYTADDNMNAILIKRENLLTNLGFGVGSSLIELKALLPKVQFNKKTSGVLELEVKYYLKMYVLVELEKVVAIYIRNVNN
jgi:hypothetical protein